MNSETGPAAPDVGAEPEDGRGILIRQIVAAPSSDAAPHGRAAKSDAPPAPATFPRDDLRTALRASYRSVRGCRTGSGPTEIDGTLRFEPSGEVSVVDLGPAVGRVASCVKERLAEVTLLAFEGSAVDVKVRVIF